MSTDNTMTTSAGGEGPRTETESRIWAALEIDPQTTAQVVVAASVGRSTAAKALSRWAASGLIIRHDGDPDTPATWAHLPELSDHGNDEPAPDPGGISAAVERPEAAASDGEELRPASEGPGSEQEPGIAGSAGLMPVKPKRLQPGELHRLVGDHLRENPGEEFGPSQISKHLNRSSGAINNALEKMVDEGVAVKTQVAPKRFALAPDEAN